MLKRRKLFVFCFILTSFFVSNAVHADGERRADTACIDGAYYDIPAELRDCLDAIEDEFDSEGYPGVIATASETDAGFANQASIPLQDAVDIVDYAAGGGSSGSGHGN